MRVFKIVSALNWREAERIGRFVGATIDLQDGYIHLSSAAQVEETAAKHFAGEKDLVLVAFDSETLGAALQWEVSRGGALFPHFYGALLPQMALWSKPLPWNGARHEFPEGWNT